MVDKSEKGDEGKMSIDSVRQRTDPPTGVIGMKNNYTILKEEKDERIFKSSF